MASFIYTPLPNGSISINDQTRYPVGGFNFVGFGTATANLVADPAYFDAVFTTGDPWPNFDVFETGSGNDRWWDGFDDPIGFQADLSATDSHGIFTAVFTGAAQGTVLSCDLSVTFNLTSPTFPNYTGFKIDTQYDNYTFAIPASGTFTASQPGWIGQVLNGNVTFEMIYTFVPGVPGGLADVAGTFTDIRLVFEVEAASNPQIRRYDGYTDRVFARIPNAT